jgi:uncharacterized protein (TIGR03435 family)
MTGDGFDLTAKVSDDDLAAYKQLNGAQHREMLKNLLIERFHLKVHTETRTLPVYHLVVDKGGSKLKPTTAIEAPSEEEQKAHPDRYRKGFLRMGPGMFEATGVPVQTLASQLSNALERPVDDRTGLTGLYDISLHYRNEGAASAGNAETDAPSIFSAVHDQLGLKLVPDKGPVETLVVDSAEKPDAN